ncbi:hypothetical protein BDV59DRAFT_179738 [Aspergillus ambiguus]|uniref:uncharacterized protein n=1 Tax=Aspergillus ambiguus TaxID=176160 RepID=UPI003CCD2FBC
MVPLTDETGRPTSAAPFDRTSIMFASPSQSDLRAYSTPRGSAYFDPNTGLVQDPSSSSSPARSRDAPSSSRSATPRGQPSPPR